GRATSIQAGGAPDDDAAEAGRTASVQAGRAASTPAAGAASAQARYAASTQARHTACTQARRSASAGTERRPSAAGGGGRDRRLDRSREATARYQRDRVVHQAGAQERSRRPAGASPHVPRGARRGDARKAPRELRPPGPQGRLASSR